MKSFVLTATMTLGLSLAASGLAYAAGQPELPGDAQGQGSAQQRMDVKRSLDANKFQQPLPQSAANQSEPSTDAAKTGVEPRGTKVAPPPTRPRRGSRRGKDGRRRPNRT